MTKSEYRALVDVIDDWRRYAGAIFTAAAGEQDGALAYTRKETARVYRQCADRLEGQLVKARKRYG